MHMSRFLIPLPVALALAMTACGNNGGDTAAEADRATEAAPAPAATAPEETSAVTATAVLQPTEGNQTAGELHFAQVDGRIRITGTVTGLPDDGEHGFHIHEAGDCSAPDGTSAGGHFNPAGTAHGRVGEGEQRHAGDSDNISAGADGTAQIDNWLEGASLGDGSDTDILGKGVIVHQDADDYASQPTGNAGARIACGVINAD